MSGTENHDRPSGSGHEEPRQAQADTASAEELEAAVGDPTRLLALSAAEILDTEAESAYDRLTRLATRALGAPVSLVSLVDADRQWFKSATGLPDPWAQERETPLSHSFCQHVVAMRRPLIVGNALLHPVLSANDAVEDLGVIAYAGYPLTVAGGQVLGAMCAIHPEEHDWTAEELELLEDLARIASARLSLKTSSRQALAEEETVSESRELERVGRLTREDVLSRINHDLRTPLNAVLGFGQLLELDDLSAEQRRAVERILEGGEEVLRVIGGALQVGSTAGRLGSAMEAGDVRSAVRAAISEASSSRVTILDRIDVSLEATVQGSAAELQSLTKGLISEAAREGVSLVDVSLIGAPGGGLRLTITRIAEIPHRDGPAPAPQQWVRPPGSSFRVVVEALAAGSIAYHVELPSIGAS